MHQEPFSGRGPDGEEPEGPEPLPSAENGPQDNPEPASGPAGSGYDDGASDGPPSDDGWDEAPPEEPSQGLYICLPAEQGDLSGFTEGTAAQPIAPGPLLAEVVTAVTGGDRAGLAQISEDCLFSVLSAGRRMSSWGTWLELAAMHELAVRHPAAPSRAASKNRPATPKQPAAQKPVPAPADGAVQDPAGAGTVGAPAGPGKQPADDGRIQFSEFIADEVAGELRLTWMSAADRMTYACDLAERLPVTFATLCAGLIDPVHAKIISEQTEYLSAADAAKADPELAAAAQGKTYGELRAAAARLVLSLDPDSFERRKQARRREAHVRPFREESGNAGMTARELPADEVLASWQNIEQRALGLRAAGVPGSLRELRNLAYLDLLQERDSRLRAEAAPDQGHSSGDGTASDGTASDGTASDGTASDGPVSDGPDGPGPDGGPQDGPGGNGGNGPQPHSPAGTDPVRPGAAARRPARKDTGPCLAALVNITVPLATALGLSATPGEAAGFGLLDPATARDLLAAASRSRHTRWCVTVLNPDGTAAAHGCAPGRHPPPPGPEPPGPEPPQPPPDTRARDYLRSLRARLTPIARGSCDHQHAETGYQPSRKLQHLIRTRSTRCTAPGCTHPAARCDLDHTLAWDKGGITCECGLAPLRRHYHRPACPGMAAHPATISQPGCGSSWRCSQNWATSQWRAVPETVGVPLYSAGMTFTCPIPQVGSHLAELVDRARRSHEHVVLTEHGQPAAVLISVDELDELQRFQDNSDIALGEAFSCWRRA